MQAGLSWLDQRFHLIRYEVRLQHLLCCMLLTMQPELLLPTVLPSACAPAYMQDDELPSVDFVLDIARAAVLRCATRWGPSW